MKLPSVLLNAFRVPALVPQFTRQRVGVSAGRSHPPGGAAIRETRVLDLAMMRQEQTNWCWAGVSVSIAAFYDASTTWTQCELVNAELGRTDCCGGGGSGACNRPWTLNAPLTRVGHLRSRRNGSLSFHDVVSEINAGDPLCCRTEWIGGSGHFVALRGYSEAPAGSGEEDFVSVSDPWDGDSEASYEAFRTAYLGSGTWTHSYRCQP
jgi:hypothetical protein